MDAKLLIETIDPERKPVVYENREDGTGRFLYLKGLFLEGEVRNHNGRWYPVDQIERAVKGLAERIKQRGPQAGELDHPEGLNINFERVSHAITEIHMDGKNGVGTLRVMNAGRGLILKGAVDIGIEVGVSSRGSGNLSWMDPSQEVESVSDFDLVTIDAVLNPSAPNAFPKASFAESLMVNPHGREACYLSECVANDEAAQRYLRKELRKFFSDIRDEVSWRK